MKDGICLGAVGVSGVKSSADAQIARVGIAAMAICAVLSQELSRSQRMCYKMAVACTSIDWVVLESQLIA